MTRAVMSEGVVSRLLWPFRDTTGDFAVGWVVAADLVLWAAWFGLLQLFVYMPPATGLAWVLVVGAVFLRRYSASGPVSTSRRHVPVTLRFGVARAGAVAAAALSFSVFGQLWSVVYRSIPGVGGPTPTRWAEYGGTPLGLLVTAVLLIVMAPVLEELCYRGWVMPAIKQRYGSAAGVIGSSLLFGLLHAGPAWAPYYVVPGIVLGLAVHRTGSVWTGVVLHGAYNALTFVRAPFFPTPESFGREIDQLGAGSWSGPLALAISATALYVTLARLVPRAGSPRG